MCQWFTHIRLPKIYHSSSPHWTHCARKRGGTPNNPTMWAISTESACSVFHLWYQPPSLQTVVPLWRLPLLLDPPHPGRTSPSVIYKSTQIWPFWWPGAYSNQWSSLKSHTYTPLRVDDVFPPTTKRIQQPPIGLLWPPQRASDVGSWILPPLNQPLQKSTLPLLWRCQPSYPDGTSMVGGHDMCPGLRTMEIACQGVLTDATPTRIK